MIRTLAPSGNPVPARDILGCLSKIGTNESGELATQICERLKSANAFLFSTGRAAMTQLLRCMAEQHSGSGKDVVIVPSYTCYSVAASALKAGLRLLVCDIDRSTLCYDREQLESVDFDNVLAVISCNLYGIPDDLTYLESVAKQNSIFMVDDAAQSLGAQHCGRAVGSFGDGGILSFDKGKVITTINGGVIVTNNFELAEDMRTIHARAPLQPVTARAAELIKLLAYSTLLRPALYWVPSHLPFLNLGKTRYDESFQVSHYFDLLAPLAIAQLSRLDVINEHRRQCAARYSTFLNDNAKLKPVEALTESEPVYLRYPVRMLDPDAREKFLQENRALGCSVSYPSSLADISEIRDRMVVQNGKCEAGRDVARQLVTLPTHAYVQERDIAKICSNLSR